MKIAVCDDDRSILDLFRDMLSRSEHRSSIEPRYFSGADELLEACRKESFDLIFSDIMLGRDNGIKTAAQVCAANPETRVVFITSHVPEFAEEIFSGMRPYGYIGKPVSRTKVEKYITRVQSEAEQALRYITVKLHGVECRLMMDSIRYIESEKRQVHIHCAGRTISLYDKLDNMEAQTDSRFVRCHQSFLVNLDYVVRLEGSTFSVDKGGTGEPERQINISRNRLEKTRRAYFEHKGRNIL